MLIACAGNRQDTGPPGSTGATAAGVAGLIIVIIMIIMAAGTTGMVMIIAVEGVLITEETGTTIGPVKGGIKSYKVKS